MDVMIIIRKQEKPLNHLIEDALGYTWKITDGEKVIIDGKTGYYHKDVPGPFLADDVYLLHKGYLFQIRAIAFSGGDETFREIFNQILSTFRFIE
jgi:hypothetical protein